jgi:hypothetical protein
VFIEARTGIASEHEVKRFGAHWHGAEIVIISTDRTSDRMSHRQRGKPEWIWCRIRVGEFITSVDDHLAKILRR